MRNTVSSNETHVWLVSDETPMILECGGCKLNFPDSLDSSGNPEFCDNCGIELLYPSWAEW